jgi:dehydrogenase/reductase SDR family protein 7B
MKDKVIIITGGSSGIGKALAEKFGREGSKLIITGRRKEQLEDVANDLRHRGIEVTPVVADASIEDDCAHVVDTAIHKYGQIDVLINNAGISMRALFEDLQLEVFRKIMDVNFYGLVNTTKYALPYILRSKGSIVGIASVNGRRATPARSAYSASKFAMIGFLESLRSEMLDRGVHVLTACPGFTASNIRRAALMANGKTYGGPTRDESYMMSAEEVADHVYTAVVRRKRDILLTLQGKLAVWLNYFFPKWMDRKALQLIQREQQREQEESTKHIGARIRT